jgi:hypothetical protein
VKRPTLKQRMERGAARNRRRQQGPAATEIDKVELAGAETHLRIANRRAARYDAYDGSKQQADHRKWRGK